MAKDDSSIVEVAQTLFQRDKSAWEEVYRKADDDLHFLSDDMYAQWSQEDYSYRINTGRPALTIDQLSQFVHQVANDIRQNTPAINIIPGGKEADEETAEIYKGLIRNIEYRSNADDVYDNGATSAIKCSIGFMRVDHDYCMDEGFEQELLIKRVNNPLACWIDSSSIECDGRDAMHGTILDKILVSEFKKTWPKAEVCGFEDSDKAQVKYKDGDYITIAEFFRIEESAKDMMPDENGEMVDWVEGAKMKRTIKKRTVHRYKLSGKEVLERTTFPGKYIPIVPIYGEEAWRDGKRNYFSLIRKAKPSQIMYNYWKSLETELLMKAPKAPVMVGEGQIDAYAADWLNPDKSMALRYKQFDKNGNALPAPQRLEPPQIPTGVVNASRETIEEMKGTMGLYNAALGLRGSATSGKQELAQQQEGDVATFHFADNLNRSITQVGRILVHAIPEIYDTPRIIRIIGIEDEPKEVGINGATAEDQERQYDLTKGSYDVRVIAGPSYTTKRQETVAALSEIIARQPELAGILGDIYFKNSDFSGAEAMAERMKKWIEKNNPGLIESEDGAPPPDPEKIQLQQAFEKMQQEYMQLKMNENNKQGELAVKQGELELKAADLELKRQELEMKGAEALGKFKLEDKKIDADLTKTRISAKQTASPEVAMADPDLHDGGVSPLASILEQFAIASQNQAETLKAAIMEMAQGQNQQAQAIVQSNMMIAQAITKPKRVVTDSQGNITGVQ